MTVLSAWQAILAAEHAAIFGYAALGPRLSAADGLRARDDERSHRHTRDVVAALVTATGSVPVASLADYPLPGALDSALAARRLALELETACARAWRFLLAMASAVSPESAGAAGDATRAEALRGLTAAAVRAMRWRQVINPGAPTEPFPGI